ncbi:Tubby-like F-box protein 10 [Raphanus sativus]|uniref:Tubby-like F-box protein n=2 Tax=Raphanus sativus TaxID=3726 RepID=A0A6J0KV12_RAPSA|nr:tubby-like F-box protein 10 isoform X1 [Raphanus sativus]XP_056849013.1 tubby-like F-box protein 10 isoform X1 [Raphanus sativus]XP_056849014.1 tubby-like F-box protein 10 isoform X1 [Raphanus sativus]XP_056849015.1 tubby-like F-box protein 10 isoform X1 [Raphanus sativus]XP_056855180.1 tubby-like F-box protein 10 isoform X1 [Raphanus sativus]KAJ4869151.1 Tubby-like F-box protein 10 [Raphanus sativus]KAJ4879790.1 Tubby-like F-box protein 10 [Raphanus sativus]
MSFRSIVQDLRDGLGSLSRRSFDFRLHHKGKSQGSCEYSSSRDLLPPLIVQTSRWANLPPELLLDVIKRLEESESTWPARKHVVACASVCRSWRAMCQEIVMSPEICGKLTFPVSLKQPGPRDAMVQCFIKRDKSKLTFHLFLCLSPALLVENGKFLLSAKRTRRTTRTEYIISMDADNISRSSNSYLGKLRSNFLGTKFLVYDTQPPQNTSSSSSSSSALITDQKSSRSRFHSKRVSPKLPSGSYNIAQITYELNVLGTRGPRRMHCIMNSIPTSSLEPGGSVPNQPEKLLPPPPRRSLDESFRSNISFSKSSLDHRSIDFSSSRFSDIGGGVSCEEEREEETSFRPLVLKNKQPRWHEQLQCWCLNFRGRVTVASVKNFQLVAVRQPPQTQGTGGGGVAPAPGAHGEQQDKVILQFGKVGKDMFTMDYRYPLSAFQAFAICLSSFDTKLACE